MLKKDKRVSMGTAVILFCFQCCRSV